MSGRAHDAVGAVFQALLEAALRDAAAGAFEDEEEDEGKGTTPCLISSATRAARCISSKPSAHDTSCRQIATVILRSDCGQWIVQSK